MKDFQISNPTNPISSVIQKPVFSLTNSYQRVATLAHEEETSYVEHLFQAKQKERAKKAQKKKKRLLIPIARITRDDEEQEQEGDGDDRPSKKQKLEKDEENDGDDIIEGSLGGLLNY